MAAMLVISPAAAIAQDGAVNVSVVGVSSVLPLRSAPPDVFHRRR
jgi:hypothetical protein